ncbi:hypothetical protein SS05631_b64110 (plasmid) [Sinorhizobium sp. CCBAU 05631]|nr:hypothetical protein SS05631_b64110 [Sinorhizobium sp. CCBAU 05631]
MPRPAQRFRSSSHLVSPLRSHLVPPPPLPRSGSGIWQLFAGRP